MNSRERLINCINHKPIDRVPISTYEMVPYKTDDFYNTQPSYSDMMQFFRDNTDCIYSTGPMNTPINNTIEKKETKIENGVILETIIHGRGKDLIKRQKRLNNQNTWWTLKHFCEDLDDLDVYIKTLPDMLNKVHTNHAHKIDKELGDKGITMISVADPLCEIADSFEFGKFLIYAITETDKIYKACDAIYEYQTYHFDQIIKGGIKDMMLRIYGAEYATPPYLNPNMYYNLETKYLIPMCKKIKEVGGFPRIHSHGKIKNVLDQFMLTDMMALEPIEPIPDGDISIGEVKKICGDDVCLMGNVELKELENSNPKEINKIVKDIMDQAKGKTGLVLMPTASPINVPLSKKTEQNYHEMINAGLKYGKY